MIFEQFLRSSIYYWENGNVIDKPAGSATLYLYRANGQVPHFSPRSIVKKVLGPHYGDIEFDYQTDIRTDVSIPMYEISFYEKGYFQQQFENFREMKIRNQEIQKEKSSAFIKIYYLSLSEPNESDLSLKKEIQSIRQKYIPMKLFDTYKIKRIRKIKTLSFDVSLFQIQIEFFPFQPYYLKQKISSS